MGARLRLSELHRRGPPAVRRILEPVATRLATPRLTDETLERLEQCLHRMETAESVPEYIEADSAFHALILEACGNATLASLIQSLSSGTLRARLWQSLVAPDAVAAIVASHRAIYNALVARDADMAAAADVMHLGIAEEWLRRLLAEDDAAAPTVPAIDAEA